MTSPVLRLTSGSSRSAVGPISAAPLGFVRSVILLPIYSHFEAARSTLSTIQLTKGGREVTIGSKLVHVEKHHVGS